MTKSACPDENTLRELLAGLLPADEAETQEQHLAHCPHCSNAAESLTPDDTLLEALRETDACDRPEEPIVDELIERLSGLPSRPIIRLMLTEDELRSILAAPQEDDELGRLGRYRVLEVIGVGGMGVVFKVEDTQLGRVVALKVMKPKLAASRSSCQRFHREACATAAFEHNHIVTIYNVGEERGIPYFTMQLLEGESLRDRVDREGTLPTPEVLRIGREIATGLAAAHGRGLLHRDIKPDNIWLEAENGQVKIVDFGLARAVDQPSSGTLAGTVLGTPKYMAPEQVQGNEVDQRCDLFSLGSLMYHLATGETPFHGNNLVATLVSVAQEEVVAPSRLNPNIPSELSDLIVQLMAKSPDQRIQTASEVVRRIEGIERVYEQRALKPDTVASRRLVNRWSVAIAAAFVFAAASIIYVATNRGTLVIEADDSIAVSIRGGKVTVRDCETDRRYDVSIGENRLKTGQYEIVTSELGTGVRFSSTEFSIRRGHKQRIRISIADEATARRAAAGVAPPQTETRPPSGEFVVPAWVADAQGGYDVRPGDPLSPRSMVQRPTDLEGVLSWTVETQDHRNSVDDVAFSPDGSKIATAGRDWTVRIWETAGGSLLKIIVCPGAVRRVAWSPNGNYLATAQRGTSAADASICLWDVARDAMLIKRIQRAADRLAWSPDGTLLAFGEETTGVWAFESGEVVGDLEIQGSISSFPWIPSGKFLATAGSRGIELWDVVGGKQVGSFLSSNAFEATWSPSGLYLACLRRPVLRVSSATRVPTGRGPGPSSASSPSRRPSSGKSKPIASYLEIWDATSGDRCNSFVVSDDAVPRALAWSPDESRIAVHAHGVVSLWNVKTGSLNEMWDASSQHLRSDSAGNASSAIQWSANHRKAVVAIAGSALVWDVEQSDFRLLSDNSYGQWEHVSVNPAAFHQQQGIVATYVVGPGPDRNIVWGRELKPLLVFDDDESSNRWGLASSPDGKLLAASRPIPEALGDQPNVEIQFYSLPEAKQIGTVNVSVTPYRSGSLVWMTTWSPDGKQLAVSETRSVVVVTPQKSLGVTSARRSSPTTPRVVAVCWSSDSRYLAWPDEGRQESHVTVLDTTAEMSTQRLEVPLGEGFRVRSTGGRVAWSPTGPTLAYYHGAMTSARGGGSTDTSECLTLWESKEGSFELTAQSTQPTARSGLNQTLRATAMVFSPDAKTIAVLPAAADTMTIFSAADASRITAIPCAAAAPDELYWQPDGKRISFSSYDPARIGVVDTRTGNVSYYTAPEESGMWLAQSGGTLAIGQRNQIVFCDADFTLSATQVIDRHEPTRALYVKADGTYRTSPDATEPRIVVLKGQTQTTLTPEEFQTRYGAE